jgi:VIT1/CCC1 family predicted Fe2+/Mn2+ transporter
MTLKGGFYLILALAIYQVGYTIWNANQKLLRYHRLLEEEYHEIQHNPGEEKEELKALYALKGIEEPLLTEVVDSIMADDQQALRVMLQEELGLVLNAFDHPILQGVAVATGTLPPLLLLALLLWKDTTSVNTLMAAAGILISFLIISSLLKARNSQNQLLPALIWNLALNSFPLLLLHIILSSG